MGLSSKQFISSDGHGWNHQGLLEVGNLDQLQRPPLLKRPSSHQQQQQQSEPLKCPRCDSTNTKFCYYNNYNKSQPRHFCKTCKRHWTKGGTLRNVPVGGGRKNKRPKTSNTANKTTSKTTNSTASAALFSAISSNYNSTTKQTQQPRLGLPLTTLAGDKNFSEAFYRALGRQPSSSLRERSIICSSKSLNDGNSGIFLGSTLALLPNDQDSQFPYTNIGIFESNTCSISSNQPPNLYNYTGETNVNGFEETGMNSLNTSMSSSSISDHHQPWEIPASTEAMDLTSNWAWDDFDKFVSVEADLTLPWDDAEIKP